MFNRRQREREYFQALAAMQEMLETREKLMTLTMELAMSMALIDGTIDKSEIKEVKKWAESKTYYFDGERRVQNQELMDVYNAALETALDDVDRPFLDNTGDTSFCCPTAEHDGWETVAYIGSDKSYAANCRSPFC